MSLFSKPQAPPDLNNLHQKKAIEKVVAYIQSGKDCSKMTVLDDNSFTYTDGENTYFIAQNAAEIWLEVYLDTKYRNIPTNQLPHLLDVLNIINICSTLPKVYYSKDTLTISMYNDIKADDDVHDFIPNLLQLFNGILDMLAKHLDNDLQVDSDITSVERQIDDDSTGEDGDCEEDDNDDDDNQVVTELPDDLKGGNIERFMTTLKQLGCKPYYDLQFGRIYVKYQGLSFTTYVDNTSLVITTLVYDIMSFPSYDIDKMSSIRTKINDLHWGLTSTILYFIDNDEKETNVSLKHHTLLPSDEKDTEDVIRYQYNELIKAYHKFHVEMQKE